MEPRVALGTLVGAANGAFGVRGCDMFHGLSERSWRVLHLLPPCDWFGVNLSSAFQLSTSECDSKSYLVICELERA
jgi:hypothetical protein